MSGRRLQLRHLPRPAQPLGKDTSRRERFDTRANRLPYVAKPTPGWPASHRTGQGCGLDIQSFQQGGVTLFGQTENAPVGPPLGFAPQAPCSARDRVVTRPCLYPSFLPLWQRKVAQSLGAGPAFGCRQGHDENPHPRRRQCSCLFPPRLPTCLARGYRSASMVLVSSRVSAAVSSWFRVKLHDL
jgi:hypothetical protein